MVAGGWRFESSRPSPSLPHFLAGSEGVTFALLPLVAIQLPFAHLIHDGGNRLALAFHCGFQVGPRKYVGSVPEV